MSYISAAMFRAIGFVSRVDGLKFIKENSIRKLKNEDPEKYLQRVKRVRIDDKKNKREIKMTMMNLQKFLSQDFTTYRVHREINEVQQSENLTVYFDDLGDLYDDIKSEEIIKTKMYEIYDEQEITKTQYYGHENLENVLFYNSVLMKFIKTKYDDKNYWNIKNWKIEYQYCEPNVLDGFSHYCTERSCIYYKIDGYNAILFDFDDERVFKCNYRFSNRGKYIMFEDYNDTEIEIDNSIKNVLKKYTILPDSKFIIHNNKLIINKLSIKKNFKTKMYEIYNKDDFKISKKYYRYRINDNELKQFKNRVSLTEKKLSELKSKRQTTKVKEEIEQHKRYIESLTNQLRNIYNIDEECIKSLLKM